MFATNPASPPNETPLDFLYKSLYNVNEEIL